MASSKQKFVFATLALFLAIFVLIFGGASATAYASQYSLPGDALYPVKTSLEQTQVRLSSDAADQAELHLGFAQRRLDEIAALIDEGRFSDIGDAASEFEYHVQQAIGALGIVSAGDAPGAEELATQVAAALSNYASTLSGMAADVPETVLPAVERALMTSQRPGGISHEQDEEFELIGMVENLTDETITIAGHQFKITSLTEFDDVIAAGVMVEAHYFVDADGFWIVREIELVGDDGSAHGFFGGDDDDGNLNGAANDNGDDDDNDNGNANSNDNGNANSNDNGNANSNDNGNANSNDNGNANSNDNGNANGNDNSNANGNDNSNANSNDNSNANSNDNSNANGNDNSSNNNGGD